MTTSLKHCTNRRRGQSIVEFSLILPVLAIFAWGIIEFGMFLRDQQIMSNAARDGARAAAVGKTTVIIKTRVDNAIAPLTIGNANAGSIVSEYSVDNGVTYITLTDTAGANVAPAGSIVRVRVRYKHRPVIFLYDPLFRREAIGSMIMKREAA